METRPGIALVRVTGEGAEQTFADEPGGHRWQRVPPNEKRDRVHTSTVTVAVMPEPTEAEMPLAERDLDWLFCRGSGKGGQHRNKTDSAVQLTHRPSGVRVRCESERSQGQNKRTALAILRSRLRQMERERSSSTRAGNRKQQVGSGQRGDKRRTIRCQDGQVNDHVTGRKWRLREYLKGEW